MRIDSMYPIWRFQFGLRTLLIAALILPPLIACYWRWRDDQIWHALQAAKQRRDASLAAWRVTYDAIARGKSGASHETAAQQRYYEARQDVESAMKALHARYGNSEQDLLRAMEARRRKK
jgi:hypothetical protein